VFNVQHPKALNAAEAYLEENQLSAALAEGDQAAREHWNKLHVRHEQSPQPLSLYDEPAQRHFSATYRRIALNSEFRMDILNSKFENPGAVLKMREVFDIFAAYYERRRDVTARAVCASLRLYARLPVHAPGQTGDCFYPGAMLPSTESMRDLETRWNKLEGVSAENLAVVHSEPCNAY
jgi:hypothetical protein